MKITCQSCGAKYTVADEKVRGKTVKIRCKKCNSAIVVDGSSVDSDQSPDDEDDGETRVFDSPVSPESSGANVAEQWTVTLADGEQKPVTVAELVSLYSSGALTRESYAWKDGMENWQPLGEIAELAAVLPQMSSAGAAAAAAGAGLFGAGAADAGAAPRVAARRSENRSKDQDLFGGPKAAPEDDGAAGASDGSGSLAPLPKPAMFTAERNENSVLFTLDALRATGTTNSTAPKPAVRVDAAVDIKKLASVAPPPPKKSDIDDLMSLGSGMGGGMGGGFGGASLAAPNFSVEAPPEPPPPPAFTPAPVGADFSVPPTAQKSSNGLVIALVAVIGLLVVGGGIGGFVLLGKKSEPVAAATATAETKPTATAAATETAAATATATATAAPTETAVAAAGTATTTAKAAVGGPLPAAADKAAAAGAKDAKDAKGKTPDAPKPDDKAAAPPTAAAPAAASDAPFDRSAAVSALSGAASAASGCKSADGPTGSGRISVTFAPTGRVTTAVVEGPPFAGTSVGGCVASKFRGAKVPPFGGSPVTVHKSFSIQ